MSWGELGRERVSLFVSNIVVCGECHVNTYLKIPEQNKSKKEVEDQAKNIT